VRTAGLHGEVGDFAVFSGKIARLGWPGFVRRGRGDGSPGRSGDSARSPERLITVSCVLSVPLFEAESMLEPAGKQTHP
jgi:hypothetical protein